jgi:hypothetical protein
VAKEGLALAVGLLEPEHTRAFVVLENKFHVRPKQKKWVVAARVNSSEIVERTNKK